MAKLRVRLLGGFEVWQEDRQVGGFESQKARALLAYLICNRGRTFSRDHLAGLLWPERSPEAARHALRQAIYNLRTALPGGDGPAPPILGSHAELGFNPDAGWWLDVEAFESSLRQGAGAEAADPHHLTTAAQLYRGDLLAGFFVKDSPPFEEWLVTEQERLREAAIEALWVLMESYRRRGEYRFGLHYARRLVAVEPLSEEAHRELMRFSALAGRRSRALAQFEELETLLRNELGVEPLEETRALYESILLDAAEQPAASAEDGEPIGPLIPLVGRGETYGALRQGWQRVLGGEGHLTLVEGEAGVGKTRLIKSFLDAGTSQRRATVLKGRCYELAPPVAYQPFAEVIRNAFTEIAEDAELPEEALPLDTLQELARLVPGLPGLRLGLQPAETLERGRLFEAMARFLEGLCRSSPLSKLRPATFGDPLILFLDDLHLADGSTLDLLAFLTVRLRSAPVWFVVTYLPGMIGRDHLLWEIGREAERAGASSRLQVGRLDSAALEEIAAALVGDEHAAELGRFLGNRSAGLPLAVAELINFLWDEGVLVAGDAGRWNLAGSLHDLEARPAQNLDELIRGRIRRLPNSTRRLAALAAVAGQTFEVQLLQSAADEHVVVVELGLEILLKRWLIRQFAHSWTSSGRERDIILWARGARRGNFEFSHKRIRSSLYQEVNPLRRQAMHEQVADALEAIGKDRYPEALAYHLTAAGLWERALPALEQSAERARAVLAEDVAQHYQKLALEALDRLATAARTDAEASRWRSERARR